MNIILQPTFDVILLLLLSIGFFVSVMKDKRALSVIISRLFLMIGCLIFIDNFYVGDLNNSSILESGVLFFEFGVVTLIVSSLAIYSRLRQGFISKVINHK